MRTLEISSLERAEASATTGTPAEVSSAITPRDSHSGGGRITPETFLASARAAARSPSAPRPSQVSTTSWVAVRAAPRRAPTRNSLR